MRPKRKRIFRETREFVEKETGRGTANSTLTTNPNTALSAMRKNSTKQGQIPISPRRLLRKFWGFSISRGGKNPLVYIGKGDSSIMAHENAHNAFRHYKKKNKQETVFLATEMFACSFQLEWLLERDKAKYDKIMGEKYSHFKLKKALSLASINGVHSKPGMILAKRIQSKFNPEQRKQFRQELLKMDFRTQDKVIAYMNERITM